MQKEMLWQWWEYALVGVIIASPCVLLVLLVLLHG